MRGQCFYVILGTGAYGKRTYFQQRDAVFYVLDIQRISDPIVDRAGFGHENEVDSLIDVKLEDDTVRERILYTEERPAVDLNPTEQCILMGLYYFIQKSEARTEISDRKLHPHVQTVLDASQSNRIWSVRVRALLERSKLEESSMRTVERGLKQVETLVDSLRTKSSVERMKLIYTSGLVPFWEVELVLIKLYRSLGCTKSALDIALRLELWEDIIDCYHSLNLRHKAAEVIQDKIKEKGESPLLLCMLGDATDDEDYYHQALKLSKNKSSRAYKALGTRAFDRKDYKTCIEYLDKSIEINRYQLSVLSRLGFASMQVEDWKAGSKAYRLYTSFEREVRLVSIKKGLAF